MTNFTREHTQSFSISTSLILSSLFQPQPNSHAPPIKHSTHSLTRLIHLSQVFDVVSARSRPQRTSASRHRHGLSKPNGIPRTPAKLSECVGEPDSGSCSASRLSGGLVRVVVLREVGWEWMETRVRDAGYFGNV
jgi:hypothetical protein